MKLHELKPAEGSRKERNRVGRGTGSGNGKTSGRGHKGQNARSGGGVRPGFEGGQMPIYRRLPKRGFKNIWAKKYVAINLLTLEKKLDDGAEVSLESLRELGVIKKKNFIDGIRVLGKGELTKKLNVKAAGVSESAKQKIEAAGGTVEILKPKVVETHGNKKERLEKAAKAKASGKKASEVN